VVALEATNMLCSIFDENEVEVGTAPWNRGNEVPAVASQIHRPGAGASAEALRLQAKLDESLLLMEARAKEAWENGLRAGEAAARKSQDEQIRETLELLAKTVAEVSSIRGETIRRAEADTVRLSIEIARRVLHRELSVDPSALEALIKAAIARLQTQEIYRVRVHPDLEPLMRACLEQAGRGSAVELVGDRALAKGGASFEINRGTLDASLDTQLREIEYGLVDEIRRRA
jgi:flagellar assembly protein FliH